MNLSITFQTTRPVPRHVPVEFRVWVRWRWILSHTFRNMKVLDYPAPKCYQKYVWASSEASPMRTQYSVCRKNDEGRQIRLKFLTCFHCGSRNAVSGHGRSRWRRSLPDGPAEMKKASNMRDWGRENSSHLLQFIKKDRVNISICLLCHCSSCVVRRTSKKNWSHTLSYKTDISNSRCTFIHGHSVYSDFALYPH